ncbi:hypothetical protein Tco_1406841 [Tanacetum coccineum]
MMFTESYGRQSTKNDKREVPWKIGKKWISQLERHQELSLMGNLRTKDNLTTVRARLMGEMDEEGKVQRKRFSQQGSGIRGYFNPYSCGKNVSVWA